MKAVARNPGDIVTEVNMTRQVRRCSFLLVEGSTDLHFWRNHSVEGDCDLINSHGKKNVLGAIARLDQRVFSGALGLVDADYDGLTGVSPNSKNLVQTDEHDLEGLLLRSRALDRVLAEHGSEKKLLAFEASENRGVREALLSRGLVFGRLRWLAAREGWPADFTRLRPSPFTDPETWTVDEQRLYLSAVTMGCPVSEPELKDRLASLPPADPWAICQGHDLVQLLVLGLRKRLGNLKASVGEEQIAGLLRQGLDQAELFATPLASRIRTWETRTPPYRVLRTRPSPSQDPKLSRRSSEGTDHEPC